MTPRILACLTALSLSSLAQETAALPKELVGTGHECKGRFSRTAKTLYWKAVFDLCRSPYTVISHDGQDWLLQVKSGKTCGYNFVEITASPDHSHWVVAGFTNPDYPHGNILCAMYEVTPSHPRRTPSPTAFRK